MKKSVLSLFLVAGIAAAAETPDVYLDYVVNDGTQYFNTGITGKAYTKVEIDFMAEKFPSNETYIMGSMAQDGSIVAPWYYNYGIGLYCPYILINSNPYAQTGIRYKIRNTIEPGYQNVSWIDRETDEVLKEYGPNNNKDPSTYSGSTEYPMYLFACNEKGTAKISDGTLLLYRLKIWQKEAAGGDYVLKRDYRPANKNGKACLFDEVEKTVNYPLTASGSEGAIMGSPSYVTVYATEKNGKSPVEQLVEAVSNAKRGTIITLEEGVYKFPDDVFMADNTLDPFSESYAKFRLNVTQMDIVLRGANTTSRKEWTRGEEPVVIDGNGAKGLQIQLPQNGSMRVENITFVNCNGGAYGSKNESVYGNWCNGGAIGIGVMAYGSWNGGDNVVVSNCVFRGNHAAIAGAVGGKGRFFVKDCLFENNTSDKYGTCMYCGNAANCDFVQNEAPCYLLYSIDGCTFTGNFSNRSSSIAYAEAISNSVFVDNSIANGIWAPLTKSLSFANCHYTNNTVGVEGVLFAEYEGVPGGVVTNCTVHNCKVGNQSRGVISDASLVVDCRVTSSGGYGGGGYTLNAVNLRTYVKDCYFGGNDSSLGGGGARLAVNLSGVPAEDLAEPLLVFDNCVFETNKVSSGNHGGAILNAASNIPEGVIPESLVVCSNNCRFIGNISLHASGVKGVTAIGCYFNSPGESGFNYLGGDASCSKLVECECSGGNLYRCSVDRSWIHGNFNFGIFSIGCSVSNTLVSGCVLENSNGGFIGRYYSSAEEIPLTEFVNCTFAANKGNFFFDPDNRVRSVNCAYFDNTNRQGVVTAFNYRRPEDKSENVVFENCAFGPLDGSVLPLLGENNMTDVVPLFGESKGRYENEPYYLPKLSSPLTGRGLVLGYSADDLDFSGNPRVREGRVDIGCYQCWVLQDGWMMLIR